MSSIGLLRGKLGCSDISAQVSGQLSTSLVGLLLYHQSFAWNTALPTRTDDGSATARERPRCGPA